MLKVAALVWYIGAPVGVAAQQGSSDPTDWTGLAQYGVLGLIVLAFIFGRIVPGYIYERRVVEVEQLRAENKSLDDSIKDRVIPAVISATDVLSRVLDRLDEADRRDRERGRAQQ